MRQNWLSIDMCVHRGFCRGLVKPITSFSFQREKSLSGSKSLLSVTTSSVEVGWVVLTTQIIIYFLVNIWVFWPTKGVVWSVIWVGERVLWIGTLSCRRVCIHYTQLFAKCSTLMDFLRSEQLPISSGINSWLWGVRHGESCLVHDISLLLHVLIFSCGWLIFPLLIQFLFK